MNQKIDLVKFGLICGVIFNVLLAVLIVIRYYWREYTDRDKDLNDGCNGLR
jgi:hypothetical protein